MSNALDNGTLAEIAKEVKSLGEDTKKTLDSLQRDLEAARKIADEAKGAINSPETKAQIDALKELVTSKYEALETQIKSERERADELEKKANRIGAGGDEQKNLRSEAIEFKKTALANRGALNLDFDPSKVSADEYKAFADNFGTYLRKDKEGVELKAMSVGSDPNGGYLVPTAQSNRIIQKIYESSPLRELASLETISTDSIELPIDMDEAGAGWVGEVEDRTETSTPQVGIQRIAVHEMYAEPRVTQKFLDDASVDAEGWLSRKVADKFARVEASAFVAGDGIKRPRGILTYAAGDGRGKIRQIVSGNASAITADGLIKMVYSQNGLKEAYLANATFLMKRGTVGEVMLLKDSQNRYLWQAALTDAQLQRGRASTLLSFPLRMADDMPAVAANALSIAFGDFRAAYTIVDRLGITVLRDPYTAKPFVKFYTRKRVGGDVTDFDALVLQKIST